MVQPTRDTVDYQMLGIQDWSVLITLQHKLGLSIPGHIFPDLKL